MHKEFDPAQFREQTERSLLGTRRTHEETQLGLSLLDKCDLYLEPSEVDEIATAVDLLTFALEKEVRKSGEPSSTHSLAVAHILTDARLDKETIIAGLLHDVPEDTKKYPDERKDRFITPSNISSLYGETVGIMVDAVTKLKGRKNIDLSIQTQVKIFESPLYDPRVIFIKLADRLHNMRTIGPLDRRDQKRKARETLKVYVPLALKFGLNQWADELADLSLATLYGEMQSFQKLKRSEHLFPDETLSGLSEALELVLGKTVSAAYLEKPSLYHLYREFGEGFLGMSDRQLAAKLTIVVNQPEPPGELVSEQSFLEQDYWKAQVLRCFGIIEYALSHFPSGSAERLREALEHDEEVIFPLTIDDLPVELRFIDNETQLREQASLLDYYQKEPGDPLHDYAEENLERLRENLRRVQQTGGVRAVAREFIQNLDVNLILVFSEDGREYVFPRGRATVLDAAYAFRTDLGKSAVSATILRNGQKLENVSLGVFLKEGDQVMIKSDPQAEAMKTPYRLDYLFTPYAKREERKKLRRLVEREKSLPDERQIVINQAIERGIAIVEDLFASTAQERGFRHARLIVGISQAQRVFADYHQKMLLLGRPEEDLLTDFLTHVGLDEIRMEGSSGEILRDTVNALIEFQFSLVPIHLIVEDVPGAIGDIGGLFAERGINIETMDDRAFQKKPGLHWVTVLIAPDKLDIFEEKVREQLEKATFQVDGQRRKMIRQVIVHESGIQLLNQKR